MNWKHIIVTDTLLYQGGLLSDLQCQNEVLPETQSGRLDATPRSTEQIKKLEKLLSITPI